jgi:hypothetical protein
MVGVEEVEKRELDNLRPAQEGKKALTYYPPSFSHKKIVS